MRGLEMDLVLSVFRKPKIVLRVKIVGNRIFDAVVDAPCASDFPLGVASMVSEKNWVGFFSKAQSINRPNAPDYENDFNVFIGQTILSDSVCSPRLMIQNVKEGRVVELWSGIHLLAKVSQRRKPFREWWRDKTYRGTLEDDAPTFLQCLEESVPNWRPEWMSRTAPMT